MRLYQLQNLVPRQGIELTPPICKDYVNSDGPGLGNACGIATRQEPGLQARRLLARHKQQHLPFPTAPAPLAIQMKHLQGLCRSQRVKLTVGMAWSGLIYGTSSHTGYNTVRSSRTSI